jgi:hypothetical protein
MNRLLILLLLYILSAGNVSAASIQTSTDVSLVPTSSVASATSVNMMHKIASADNEFHSLSEFSQAKPPEKVPPTLWIVGLGLCLVFLGYKMKNKAE